MVRACSPYAPPNRRPRESHGPTIHLRLKLPDRARKLSQRLTMPFSTCYLGYTATAQCAHCQEAEIGLDLHYEWSQITLSSLSPMLDVLQTIFPVVGVFLRGNAVLSSTSSSLYQNHSACSFRSSSRNELVTSSSP